MNREKSYRRWLQKRREVGKGTDLADRVMARLDEPLPASAVPPQPPAPAPDAWPDGPVRVAAAAGLVGLGLFRLAYVGASLLMP